MKKLYCLIFLLLMPSVYGMQKKNKSHKKLNIHNVRKKNSKKSGSVLAKNKQLKEELYQLERVSFIKEHEIGLARDNRILASIVVGAVILFPTAVRLDHYMRGISCSHLLNWYIEFAYK